MFHVVVGAVAQCVCGFSAGRVAPLRRDAAPRQIACAAKGGKGGAAAAALEALAALEQAAPQEEAPTVAEPSPFKKPQGGGKGGAAAAALAALEGLGFDDEEQKRPELEKSGWKKKDKSGKGGAAAAALAALEGLDLGDGETNQAVLDVVGKKKDKGGKGGASKAALAALEGFDFDEDEAKAVLDAVGGKEAKLDFAEEDWRKPEAVGDGRRAEPELKESRSKKMDLGEDDFDDDVGAKKSKKNKAQAEEEGVGGKKGKKNKKGKRNDVEAEAEVPSFTSGNANDADEDLTLEEKKKRERGNAKVRIIDRDSRAGVATMSLSKVSMIFRNTEVLKDASWRVTSGDRVGIVGANGGGKTTMLKIFSGELEPTSGEVITSSERLNVAYLRQEFSESLVLTRSLREELASVFTAEAAALERLRVVELAVEGGDSAVATLDEFAEAQDVVNKLGANTVEGKCEKVAIQMGFGDADLEAVVGSFSGGWKMRIGLAKVLLEQPDVLLLDEPTNHLDLDSVYWLEEFLRQQTIAIVTVSHDREFIDQVCTKIVDVEDGVTVSYDDCNYSQFLKRKEQRRQAWESAYKKQQSKINEDKEFINRFRAGARAAQAQSREKMLDKLIKSSDIVLKPPSQKRGLAFRFPEPPRCGVDVLSAKSVAHGYGDRELFRDVSFELRRGDRVAILGPNGAGKSTLLRLLAGIEAADEGGCEFGSANVAAAYFAQNQADAMDMSKTVLRTIEDASLSDGAERSYETLRALLGQFLFKGDDVQKHLSSLSGGEKARVALCRMMLEANNVLFLDEPTNHLDIPAKEMLEDALVHFDGTLVVVSHDRYFVSQVCNTIFNLENGSMERFDCDYASYLEAKSGLKGKVEGRYVAGVKKIEKAKVVDFDDMQKNEKRSFGGKAAGVSGRKDKGIKNAKRMA